MSLDEEGKRLLDIELAKAIEQEEKQKNLTVEDLHHQKKYLIEGILEDGESLTTEMEKKNVNVDYESPYRKMVEHYYEIDQPRSEVKKKEVAIVEPTQKKSFWRRLGEAIFG